MGFINFLGPLLKPWLSLKKNVLTPLARTVLMPLGLTAAASTTDVAIQKNSLDQAYDYINNFKQRNERYPANS